MLPEVHRTPGFNSRRTMKFKPFFHSSARKEANSYALDDDTVYLEDLEGPSNTPAKPKRQRSPLSSSKKANKYRDHDPYRLPELDLEEKITKATRSTVPDPRLATEEELRLFIEEM